MGDYYDGDVRINYTIFLNDGSLFIVKDFYSNHEDPRTELHIWMLNENKEWVITKEEEFEGENDLSINNIYIYEDDTLIFSPYKNGLYSLKILNN